MNFIEKIVDFLVKPINTAFLLGIFLVSTFIFCFNFIPEKLLISINLKTLIDFLNNYNFILFLVMVASMFFLIVQGLSMLMKKYQKKKMAHYFQKQQDKLFEDDYAWGLLKIMYERHPDSTDLPIHNQKVKLLEQYALITRVSNQKLISWYDDLNDPYFPYVLQPVAEEKLKEKLN